MASESSYRNGAVKSVRPIRVWCLLRDQYAHVKPVEEFLGDRAGFVYDSSWDPGLMLDAAPDAVVCVNDVHYDVARCLDAARKAGIPSVVLQDGILEWRCQYENPRLGAGGGPPQHQPVLADKIVCIGPSSARHLAAWGNAGKVEVTGMPRLDPLLASDVPARRRPSSRLLVMTAKKPGFTDKQVRVTLRSLRDLKNHLESLNGVEVIWRLTKGLAAQIGVENRLTSLGGGELADQLRGVDAVITTPSTAMLEAMIADRPVGCLDYHNTPKFVATAWTISAPGQIEGVVAELLTPSAAKMAFQRVCLRDSLLCDGSAAARVGELILILAAGASSGEANGAGLNRTARAAAAYAGSGALVPSLGELYPGSTVFEDNDPRSLQVRLVRAESENARLRREQSERGLGHWVQAAGRATARRLKARLHRGVS